MCASIDPPGRGQVYRQARLHPGDATDCLPERRVLVAEKADMVAPAEMPTVVIVAYHNTDDLRAALAGLGDGFDVVGVDNGGEAEGSALCGEVGARYLAPGRNVGFAAAVNLGLAQARASGP